MIRRITRATRALQLGCYSYVIIQEAKSLSARTQIPTNTQEKNIHAMHHTNIHIWCRDRDYYQTNGSKTKRCPKAMKRKMLGVKWQDHITNNYIKDKSNLPDFMETILRSKWKWACHVARMQDSWAVDLTVWKSRSKKKPGRLKMRWVDNITRLCGKGWIEPAQNRAHWSQLEEAFIQQWRNNG